MFFVCLPVETRTVTTGTGPRLTTREWTTFFGAEYWARSTDQMMIDAVLDSAASLKHLFVLLPPVIHNNDQDTSIDYSRCHKKLIELCLSAGWEHITAKVYIQLCLYLKNDPVTIIQSIHQEYYLQEDSTQKITQSVEEYFKAIQQMTNFLPKKKQWPLDVTLHFNTHLIEDVKHQMTVRNYQYAVSRNDGSPYSQLLFLQEAYSAACLAELNVSTIQNIIKKGTAGHTMVAIKAPMTVAT
eukprot:4324548-Ditylum_brightwellii.AAC.1